MEMVINHADVVVLVADVVVLVVVLAYRLLKLYN